MAREPVADVPTLIVIGDRSWIEFDAHRYPAAADVSVSAGHSILFDALEQTAAAVGGFLSDSASRAAP